VIIKAAQEKAYKDAGLWIDGEELAFSKKWSEKEMLTWARGYFQNHIDDLRSLDDTTKHKNIVSLLWMKGRNVMLVPSGIAWDGRRVSVKGRLSGKSAATPAGRLALGMCIDNFILSFTHSLGLSQ
jgi:hypothetical protein